MPEITRLKRTVNETQTITPATLDGSTDTLTFDANAKQSLYLNNTTGGALNINVIGSTAPADYTPPGYGDPLDLTAGFAITIPDGQMSSQFLPSISKWLAGSVTITGGTGLLAYIVED